MRRAVIVAAVRTPFGKLGGGAVLERGPVINTPVYDLLVRTAEEDEIPHAFEVSTRATHTDADRVHISRGGVPTGLVSVPLRYMHSPIETVDLDDIEHAVQLIVAFALKLDSGLDLAG